MAGEDVAVRGDADRLAPVTPLFGDRESGAARVSFVPRGLSVGERGHEGHHDLGRGPDDSHDDTDAEPSDGVGADLAAAERKLVNALARRALSVREATSKLRADGVTSDDAADVVSRLIDAGALSDELLADQIVHVATTRKDQGRVAIKRELAKRGVDREVIAQTVDGLPDDDAERARAFAEKRAVSLARLDPEVALRRLVGQLSRRGFPSLVAMNAARDALHGPARGRVRFE